MLYYYGDEAFNKVSVFNEIVKSGGDVYHIIAGQRDSLYMATIDIDKDTWVAVPVPCCLSRYDGDAIRIETEEHGADVKYSLSKDYKGCVFINHKNEYTCHWDRIEFLNGRYVFYKNTNLVSGKPEKPPKTEDEMNTNFNENKLVQALKNQLDQLIVQDNRIGLSPSGLSLNNRTFSKKEKALLEVGGTNVFENLPVGFSIPTGPKDIKNGDIVFLNDGLPLFVKDVEKNSDGKYTVSGINAGSGTLTFVPATLDLMGNQTFLKLITPFQYDGGCNPVLNMSTAFALAYNKGGIDAVVEKLTPNMVSLVQKTNVSSLLKDKRIAFMAPAVLIGYKVITDNFENLAELGEAVKIEKVKSALKKIDKKMLYLLVLALLTVLYYNKDKVAQALLNEKISNMKFIGRFSKPLSSLLSKLPKIPNLSDKVKFLNQ